MTLFWRRRKRKFILNDPDPVYNVIYLGNVVTPLAKGPGCFDKPLALIWRTYCNNVKAATEAAAKSKAGGHRPSAPPEISMRLVITRSGLKAHTKALGLTEYWAHRITYTTAPTAYPRVFVWIYKHEGKRMKPELRCHAALTKKATDPPLMAQQLSDAVSAALHEYRREKIARQNVRARQMYDGGTGELPARKAMLCTGTSNFRPPMTRSKSAPRLCSIVEEAFDEEEEEEDDDDNETQRHTATECFPSPAHHTVGYHRSAAEGHRRKAMLSDAHFATPPRSTWTSPAHDRPSELSIRQSLVDNCRRYSPQQKLRSLFSKSSTASGNVRPHAKSIDNSKLAVVGARTARAGSTGTSISVDVPSQRHGGRQTSSPVSRTQQQLVAKPISSQRSLLKTYDSDISLETTVSRPESVPLGRHEVPTTIYSSVPQHLGTNVDEYLVVPPAISSTTGYSDSSSNRDDEPVVEMMPGPVVGHPSYDDSYIYEYLPIRERASRDEQRTNSADQVLLEGAMISLSIASNEPRCVNLEVPELSRRVNQQMPRVQTADTANSASCSENNEPMSNYNIHRNQKNANNDNNNNNNNNINNNHNHNNNNNESSSPELSPSLTPRPPKKFVRLYGSSSSGSGNTGASGGGGSDNDTVSEESGYHDDKSSVEESDGSANHVEKSRFIEPDATTLSEEGELVTYL